MVIWERSKVMKKYEEVAIEVIRFDAADVICTSKDPDEGEIGWSDS